MTERLIILHERINALEAENRTLRELVSRWLEFAGDVQPSCAAGEEWLGRLKEDSERVVE